MVSQLKTVGGLAQWWISSSLFSPQPARGFQVAVFVYGELGSFHSGLAKPEIESVVFEVCIIDRFLALIVTSFASSVCFTGSLPLRPQNLNHRSFSSSSPATSHVGVALETKIKLGNSGKILVAMRGNLEATGVPTSVPIRVAHELLHAGH